MAKCGFCTKTIKRDEPYIHVELRILNKGEFHERTQPLFDACPNCTEKTRIVSMRTLTNFKLGKT